jgi:hypothetical protein
MRTTPGILGHPRLVSERLVRFCMEQHPEHLGHQSKLVSASNDPRVSASPSCPFGTGGYSHQRFCNGFRPCKQQLFNKGEPLRTQVTEGTRNGGAEHYKTEGRSTRKNRVPRLNVKKRHTTGLVHLKKQGAPGRPQYKFLGERLQNGRTGGLGKPSGSKSSIRVPGRPETLVI